jgi:hypothetical protein
LSESNCYNYGTHTTTHHSQQHRRLPSLPLLYARSPGPGRGELVQRPLRGPLRLRGVARSDAGLQRGPDTAAVLADGAPARFLWGLKFDRSADLELRAGPHPCAHSSVRFVFQLLRRPGGHTACLVVQGLLQLNRRLLCPECCRSIGVPLNKNCCDRRPPPTLIFVLRHSMCGGQTYPHVEQTIFIVEKPIQLNDSGVSER